MRPSVIISYDKIGVFYNVIKIPNWYAVRGSPESRD